MTGDTRLGSWGNPAFDSALEDLVRCARDMWLNGWAENGAGNLSVRIEPGLLNGLKGLREDRSWLSMGWKAPELGGGRFLVSARGSAFRSLRDRPPAGCGVIALDRRGERYRILWGFEPDGAPSSEIDSHMAVQAAGVDRGLAAVVHVHAPNVIALTCSVAADSVRLTRLLWSLHTECIVVFPEGVEVAPWRLPGSPALSRVTARGFARRRVVVWPFHGVVAAGRSLDEAVGLIETVEKAAGIYLKATAAGGLKSLLTEDELRAVAGHFGVVPDEEILCTLRAPLRRPAGPDTEERKKRK
jgi:rhamnulose-1-phosphate aldolase